MPFKDIDIFVRAAEAILQGHNPYSIRNLEVFYPLPFYFLFIPFVALPATVVNVIWSAIQAIIFVAILRRRAILVALSMPVLLTFLLGQVDIAVMGLYAALRTSGGGGVALAFLVLKPQLVLLLAPWMLWRWLRNDRRQIVWFAIILGLLIAASLVIQPDWVPSLVARSGERTRAAISSSLWGLLAFLPSTLWLPVAAIVALAIAIWAWRKNDFDIIASTGLLVSPYVFSYNLTPLFITVRKVWFLLGLTVLSWLTFVVGAWQSNDRASALITLAILAALIGGKRPSTSDRRTI